MKLNIFKSLIPDNSKQQEVTVGKSWFVEWISISFSSWSTYGTQKKEAILLTSKEDVEKFKDELISAFKFTKCNDLISYITVRENK